MTRRLLVMAAVVLAAVGVTAAAATAGPVPVRTRPAVALTLATRTPSLDCPGPETLLAPAGADPVPEPGPVRLTEVVAQPGGGLVAVTTTTLEESGTARVVGPSAPGRTVALTAGLQVTMGTSGDLRGLSARACDQAATEVWLVGGATLAGQRDRLLVANPSPAPVVVDVRVHGPKGPVGAANGEGVVVPGQGQVALLVDALAPGLPMLAVHVVPRSGRVTATLYHSMVRGLVGGGVDDVAAAAPAATRQVVPGMAVVAPAKAHGPAGLPANPAAPGAYAVRVVVPGTADAVVRVHLLGPHGSVTLPGGVLTVAAGSVADVPVTGVDDGSYAAVVEADVPVVASGLVGRASAGSESAGTSAGVSGKSPPAELAWAASAVALPAHSAVALPANPTSPSATPTPTPANQTSTASATPSATPSATSSAQPGASAILARLSLVAVGRRASVTVRPVLAGGRLAAPVTLTLPAGSAVTRDLPGQAVGLLLDVTGGPVSAALVLTAQDSAGPMISVVRMPVPVGGPGVAPAAVQDPRLGQSSSS